MALSPLTLLLNNNDQFLLFLSLLLLVSVIYLRNKSLAQRSKLPPSPPRLRLIGNLHQLGKSPQHSLQTLSEKYGPIFYLKLGQVPAVVVSSPDIVKEIVESHDATFSSRPKILASEILLNEGNGIIFAPYGEHLRKARKLCMVELLSLKRVQSFQHVREEEVGVLVEKVRKACSTDNNSNNGVAINLSQMLIETTKDIVSRCLLGKSYRKEDATVREFGELVKSMGAQFTTFNFGDFFPWLRWVDEVSGLVGRMRSISRELRVFLDRAIQEHKAFSGSESDKAEDFVDVLLKVHQDSNSDFEITQIKLMAIIQDVFTAAIDTSSSVAEWVMAELLRSPEAMKKVQEEVRKIAYGKGKIDMKDIDRMVYLKNVVKETLRLHPPAPLLVPHETTMRSQIGPYEIPDRTRILVNAWAIQRDPSLWDNPEVFFPERFEKSTLNYYSGNDFRFIPFGFGRRRCPGIAFSVISIEYMIANLLYYFDWKYPGDLGLVEDMDMSESNGMSVHKKVHLQLVPVVFPVNI